MVLKAAKIILAIILVRRCVATLLLETRVRHYSVEYHSCLKEQGIEKN